MENKQCSTLRKKDQLVGEIDHLKLEILGVKEKIHVLEDEEKLQICEKSALEVKYGKLPRSIEFFQEYYKKVNTRFEKRLDKYGKYSTLNETCDEMLEACREKYLSKSGNDNAYAENTFMEIDSHNNRLINNLQTKKEKLETLVEKNFSITDNLLNELGYNVV